MELLGINLVEIPEWTCCGALPPMLKDDVIALLDPIRNLINAGRFGNEIALGCPFCYSTLKRSNKLVEEDPELGEKLAAYMDERYDGHVKVFHWLEILRDRIGFEEVEKKIKVGLSGLRAAPFYGCMLLRPHEELMFDDPKSPRTIEDLLTHLKCEPVDFAYKTKCCGSYVITSAPQLVDERVNSILSSALDSGAEAVVTTCALCHFNLDREQGTADIPILYISQLLAIALGAGIETCRFDMHKVDPRPLLKDRGIV
jgi:heterodisulfide reductase subunit B